MCIFQSGKDIPPSVRISLRTLQYLVTPLLSLAILVVGSMHLGECTVQPMLPVWHMVAGSSGLLTPFFYLMFDEINPRLSQNHPIVSEAIDNIIFLLLPPYVIFEIGWLIAGTVWVGGPSGDPNDCDPTIYVFSYVVIVNFWIHVFTPLSFMMCLCCSRLFPYCGYCAYWNFLKKATDNWTRRTRLCLCSGIAFPLAVSMCIAGALSVERCGHVELKNASLSANFTGELTLNAVEQLEMLHIPIWLMVAGCALLGAPAIYFVYDKYCKDELGGPLIKNFAQGVVIAYLLCGLVWVLVGFLWVFGAHWHVNCGADSVTYRFAFGSLIVLNALMDVWVCFKICVVLYWAFLSDD